MPTIPTSNNNPIPVIPEKCFAAYLRNGWWAMDSYGPIDGPYKTMEDVYTFIKNMKIID